MKYLHRLICGLMIWVALQSTTAVGIPFVLPSHPSCQNGFLSMELEGQLVEVQNLTVTIFAIDPRNQVVYRDAFAQCKFIDFLERIAVNDNCPPVPENRADVYYDDLDALFIQSLMNSTETRCTYFEQDGPLEPGVDGKTLGINITRLDLPQTYATMLFMHPYQDFTYVNDSNTDFTFNIPLTRVYKYENPFTWTMPHPHFIFLPHLNHNFHNYRRDELKFSVELHNWNWTPSTASHYLRFYLECGFQVTQDFEAVISNRQTVKETVITSRNFAMRIQLEKTISIDQIPYLEPDTLPDKLLSGPVDSPLYVGYSGVKTLCWYGTPLNGYQEVIWDPAMQVLFRVPNEDGKKTNVVIPAAVSVSVVVILIIVIALFAKFRPSFKSFVRPFTKRKENDRNKSFKLTEVQPEGQSNWTSGTKPI